MGFARDGDVRGYALRPCHTEHNGGTVLSSFAPLRMTEGRWAQGYAVDGRGRAGAGKRGKFGRPPITP